jgi:hypothetical protein
MTENKKFSKLKIFIDLACFVFVIIFIACFWWMYILVKLQPGAGKISYRVYFLSR